MTEEQKIQIVNLREKGHSYGQIAGILSISVNTIKSFCRRNGLGSSNTKNDPKEAEVNIEDKQHDSCKYCNEKLERNPRGKPRKFCSDKCRREWWKENKDKHNRQAFYTLTCLGCGIKFESYGNKERKYCSHSCYIKSRFKGEIFND